jgi:nitrate reductase delta subunit
MARTFKVLSLLLSYPTEEIKAAAPAMGAVLAEEGLVRGRALADVLALLDEIGWRDLYDLEERYVLLFDRGRSLSLHLFEHVHGESRDRGQAMVDLQALYERHGLSVTARELPDYLPLFLEFLSILPFEEARGHLAEAGAIIAAIGRRLSRRQSVYACVFAALAGLADAPADAPAGEPGEDEADPEDLAALDRAWEDEPVTFGPGAAPSGCPKAEAMLERMTSPNASEKGA